MNNLKIYRFLFIIVFGTILCSGCNKDSFLDVNNNPNRPTDNNITPYLIFPQVARSMGIRQFSNLDFLQQWVGYQAASGTFAPDVVVTTYNIDFSFSDNYWSNTYNALFDIEVMKRKAFEYKDTVLAGASMVMSAHLFQNLVDVFGNVPFRQSFDNVKYPTPEYDNAQFIYNSLQVSLDTAIIYLSKNPTSAFKSADDILNKGDASKWIKYANTIKLRLLIRQSEISGFNPTSEVAKIINKGGVLHAGETIKVNPGFLNITNQQSSFYGAFGTGQDGVTDLNTIARANRFFDTLLTNGEDDRVSRFYQPIGGTIVPCALGAPAYSENDPISNPTDRNASKYGPGLLGSPTQDQWILTSFESLFLEAEAIERKWIPGNAKLAYEAAVKESYTWLGVPKADSLVKIYLANSTIGQYDNPPAYFTSKVQFLAFQKYISLCGINPLEAWCDIRRLNSLPFDGYISVNPNKISQKIPVRLLYPQVEYTANSSNVLKMGNVNAFSSKLFWQP